MSQLAYAPRPDVAASLALVGAALLAIGLAFALGGIVFAVPLAVLLLGTALLFQRPYLAWNGVLASVAVNMARYRAYESNVLKAITFFLSFLLVFYFVVSVVRTRASMNALIKVLVGGGAVVALLAVVEARAGFSPFTRLESIVPFLEPVSVVSALDRGGATRALGPAEHPIALS